jgi:hypothetical protein
MSRNSIVAVVVAIGVVIGVTQWVRFNGRGAGKGAGSANAKQGEAEKVDPAAKDEKSEPPKPLPKETVLGVAASGHLAEKAFISNLRAVLIGRRGQPEGKSGQGDWVKKLMAIPSDELPPERRAAWRSLMEAWRALEEPAIGRDPGIKRKGQEAAAVLNAMLKEHGDGDIQF